MNREYGLDSMYRESDCAVFGATVPSASSFPKVEARHVYVPKLNP